MSKSIDATSKVTTIDLLRHGEPEGGDMFRGHTDLPLTDLGWRQMRQAVESPEALPWQRLISSPLQRCLFFSEKLAVEHQLNYEKHEDLREISFGDWDGCSFEKVRHDYPQQLKQYWEDVVANTPPNGETLRDFQSRVEGVLQSLLAQHEGEHLLLVTHGGVIRVIMAAVLNMPLESITRIQVPYACLTRIQVYHMKGHAPWFQLQFHQGCLN